MGRTTGGGGVRIKEEWGWRQRGGLQKIKRGNGPKGGGLLLILGIQL